MKKIFTLFSFVLLSFVLFTGQKSTDSNKQSIEAPPIWNIHKLMKWYTDRGITPPQYVSSELKSGNQNFETDATDVPDIRVFPSSNPQSENSIAISEFNPQHLMISTNMTFTQSAFFSTNGGANWFGSESDPGGYSNYGDPVALFDRAGNAYWVTLTQPGGVGLTKTTNFGTTWGPLWYADPSSNQNDDKEHAMTDQSGVYPNNIYVALTDFNLSGPPVSFVRSTNGGSVWGSRVNLPIGSARGQGVNIQTGPNGEVYVAWAHYPGTTAEAGMGFAKSTDGGATFNTPSVIFALSGIRTSNGGITEFGGSRVSSFPSMAVDRSTGPRRGTIYIIYPDRSTGDADVYVNKSTDGGTTWSDKIRVNGEAVGNGKQQWMSSSAVDASNGALNVSYFSMDTTGLLTARYLATSLDGGTTWDRTKISDVRFTPGPIPGFASGYMGDYYETAAFGGKVVPCWSDNRAGAWQAYVSPSLLGPGISHVPLPNTENLAGPYIVNANISTAGSGLVTGRTKLYWGRNSLSDSITMTNGGGGNWSANIPGNGTQTQYRYYIKTIDSLGRTAVSPAGAPASYYSFLAASDTTRPVISSSPLGNQPKASWPASVSATVTDNIGIDSVWVKWYKNNTSTLKQFKLINGGGSTYSAAFNSVNSDVAIGDSIFYKIIAQDNSLAHNRDSTALYKFKIVNVILCEGFTGTTFPPTNWSIDFSGTLYWTRESASSYGVGNGSAKFNFFNASSGVIQSLNTLTFGNSAAGDSIKFDHAYCTYTGGENDQLEILTSSNGGTSYNSLILLNGGNSGPLVTAPGQSGVFTPTASQWATKKYAVPVGTNKISFKAISAFGNNLFLDSICLINGPTGVTTPLSTLIPSVYSLSQNYPNPFNPNTKINFALPKQGFVSLKVYDVLGKEVMTLVNEQMSAGSYAVDFNAANLSSGVYFFRMESGEFMDIKRMMLIK
ncbi:MAG: T9SS type A sorting domain-containing protein [Ignavibacteria bacterium]